jgi:hypothetical protein
VQPHWFPELQVQVAFAPHASVDPIGHVFVQKCVSLSPMLEHSGADCVPLQSENDAQNFPMPRSFPVSPGMPHFDVNASTDASTAR